MLREKLQDTVRRALITLLEAEVEALIAPVHYQRSEQRRDDRNGQDIRRLDMSVGHIDDLPVLYTRIGYQMQMFEGVTTSNLAFCTPSQLVVECLAENALDCDELNQSIQVFQAFTAARIGVCLRDLSENLFWPSQADEILANFLLAEP